MREHIVQGTGSEIDGFAEDVLTHDGVSHLSYPAENRTIATADPPIQGTMCHYL